LAKSRRKRSAAAARIAGVRDRTVARNSTMGRFSKASVAAGASTVALSTAVWARLAAGSTLGVCS